MKIAIINKFFFLKGGQETVALEQMKLLEQAGHQVAFFSMHHPKNPKDYYWSKYFVDYADFTLKDSHHSLSDKIKLAKRFVVNPSAAKLFKAFLEEFKPDLIHCHGIAHQLTYSILEVADKLKIPVIQTLHDFQIMCPSYTLLRGDKTVCETGCTPQNYWPCVQNRCVKDSFSASVLSTVDMFYNRVFWDYTPHIRIFISPSQFLVKKVNDSGIHMNRLMHIPNFLANTGQINPCFTNENYILYVGRLSHEKGLLTLLKAFQLLPHIQLRLAGEGPMKDRLTTYCQENHLRNVTFLGHLDRHKTVDVIKKAVAIVLPSEWYENQPMSIIEAFFYGKPVIATNMGGIPEMVIDGHNGFLFPPGDFQTLARILETMVPDQEKIYELGRNARAYALEQYGSDSHLNALQKLYSSLVT